MKTHLDAGESIFFQRELEQISAEMFDVKYAALKGRLYVPVDNSVDPGAATWTWSQYDSVGEAKRITDYAADQPLVNVKGSQQSARMESYGDAFAYSIDEIAAAAKAGKPLDRMRAMTARKVCDQKLDNICFSGDSDVGTKGLSNLSSAFEYTTPVGSDNKRGWAYKTPTEILADLNGLCDTVINGTKEVENPRRILLPTAEYRIITTTARSSNSDTNILEYFQANNRGVEVLSWERLTGAGTGASDMAIAYDPNPLNLRLLMSVEFEQQAPEKRNMAYLVNCRFKTGGVINPFPKSICYASYLDAAT